MKNYLIVSGITLGVLVIGIVIGLKLKGELQVGSVSVSNEYVSTTTSAGRFPVTYNLASGQGTLGQVTITGAAAGSITLYDATTTNINLRTDNLATSSLLIADFPMLTATSTYVYDSQFRWGLTVVTNGTIPTSTIMWRK